jgi:hypothetical protein
MNNILTQEHGLTFLAIVIISIAFAIATLALCFVLAEFVCEEIGEMLF